MEAQPLEMRDFSGGITDNILQGEPTRYAKADNFLIRVDKKLEERDPFNVIDNTNYRLPSGDQAANGSYTLLNESTLVMQSSRNLYTIDPVTHIWDVIKGPSGNEAIQGGDATAQNTFGEFQRQAYFTNDGGVGGLGTNPSKIFRNTNNTWVALSAGLPRAFVAAPFSTVSLLASAITLANALRASFVSHFSDAVHTGTFSTNGAPTNGTPTKGSDAVSIHFNQDLYSLSYLASQTLTGYPDAPFPVPTPAAAATDLTSLLALVNALTGAYTYHVKDAAAGINGNTVTAFGVTGVAFSQYHFNIGVWGFSIGGAGSLKYTKGPAGPHAQLNSTVAITTLIDAVDRLNDLRQKWKWHRKAIYTHSPTNDPNQFDIYRVNVPKITTVSLTSTYPPITPDFTDIYNFVNGIKAMYNDHATNGGIGVNQSWSQVSTPTTYHMMPDSNFYHLQTQIFLPDATNEDDFALMTFWLRQMYSLHFQDSNIAGGIFLGSYNTTAGSNTIDTPAYFPGGAGLPGFPVFYFIQSFKPKQSELTTGLFTNDNAPMELLSGLTTVLDAQSTDTSGVLSSFISSSMYHPYFPANLGPVGTIFRNVAQVSDALVLGQFSLGASDKEWLTLATDMFNAFLSHANYADVHQSTIASGELSPPGLNIDLLSYPFFIPTISTDSYAFIFTHTYTVEPNGIEYEVLSNPVFSDSLAVATSYPPNYLIPLTTTQLISQEQGLALPYPQAVVSTPRGNTISNLPSIIQRGDTNYDTANIKLEIYRTSDGGTTFFQVASLPNGTTSYTDILPDAVGPAPLTTQQELYTTGGIVGYDPAPQSKFVHVFNNTAYYGAIVDSGQFFPNRIRQSNQNQPDHAPATFFDDLDDSLTGLSSTKSNLVAFCQNSIYRMSNGFTTTGTGSLTHDRISDVIGSLNAKSIVKTEIGIFFAGNDGFYYTDGYQLIKISLELDKTYASLTKSTNQRTAIYGAYDKTTRRIWWALKSSPTSPANDVGYVFYLNFGVKPSGAFTKVNNGLNFSPSSWVFLQGVLYYGHSRGYVLKSDPNRKTDIGIDITTVASNWLGIAIPYNFTTCAIDMGTAYKRKYVTKIHAVGRNSGNMAMQFAAIRDMNADDKGIYNLTPINYVDNDTWGTATKIWGTATDVWGNSGKVDAWRRLPNNSNRADFIQFQITPAKIAVYASSVGFPFGANAVVDNVAKTARILTPGGFSSIIWPLDVVGYVIAFQTDGYVNEFKITALDGTLKIITFADTLGLSVSVGSGVPWVIRGVKKEQRVTITSLDVSYVLLGQNTQHYPGAASNLGPGNGGENPS